MQRFLVWQRGRVAPHDYPSSGIIKQVCVLGDDIQRGEPWGNRASRGVFPPLLHPVQCSSRAMRGPATTFIRGSGAGSLKAAVGQFENAAIPVCARPRISACTSCVPS